MKRFIEEAVIGQLTLLPESLDDYIDESNPVRAIDAFVAHLDLEGLGFKTAPADTGRPGYPPSSLLKLYIYATSIGWRRAGASSGKLAAISRRSG
jgi:transposase